MRKLLVYLLITNLIVSCSSSESLTEEVIIDQEDRGNDLQIYHYNILISPDLSNRTDNSIRDKPISDQDIVRIVLNNLYPNILTSSGRSQNQMDRLRLDFINKGLISEYQVSPSYLDINFASFRNQRERIDFLMNRSEKKFSDMQNLFFDEFNKIHETASKNNFGADIWTYLNNLDNSTILPDLGSASFNKITYHNRYKHKMILITDGYIEAGLYGSSGCENPKLCYYLSSNKVAEFRNAFRKSGENDLRAFFDKSGYGIVPINNSYLKDLEILAVEFNDRSLDKSGNATVFPTDFQILELFWTDWMIKSGVKNFRMKRVFSSKQEAEDEILRFFEIK